MRETAGLAPRYDRNAWLEAAVRVLTREGQAQLRIDSLAAELGVTKGSFYHHFRNREDFVEKIIDFWSAAFTDYVVETIDAMDAPPRDRLLKLTEMIEAEGLARYDFAFRSWAAQNAKVAEKVREVDEKRFAYIRSIFREMGFKGAELDMRAEIWLVYHSAQNTVHIPAANRSSKAATRRRYAFFTGDGA